MSLLLLNHPSWEIRETATKLCDYEEAVPLLKKYYSNSDDPEVRFRLNEIIEKWNRKAEIELYKNDVEAFYKKWIANHCENRYISQRFIIYEIRNNPEKRDLLIKVVGQDLGSWSRNPPIPSDIPNFERFVKTLK